MMKPTRGTGLRHVMKFLIGSLLFAGCAGSPPRSSAPATRPSPTLASIVKGFESDDRLVLCHLWQSADGSVAGFVEMPQYRDVLKANGFDVSKVKLLPEEASTPFRFGTINVDHAILRQTPTDAPGDRDNATDVIRGEVVWILDQHPDGETLVHSSDGYLGWLDAQSIDIVDEAKFKSAATTRPARAGPIANVDATARESALIRDAAFDRSMQELAAMNDAIKCEAVLAEAQTFLGTKYVWGGKTKAGIDCSGLTQTSFARHGILLPRDADQQASVGRLVATRYFKDALLPGDLLFFVSPKRGNVHHVAIYLGEGQYIEAAGKDVHMSSLKPGADGYDEKRAATFGWARRVIE